MRNVNAQFEVIVRYLVNYCSLNYLTSVSTVNIL